MYIMDADIMLAVFIMPEGRELWPESGVPPLCLRREVFCEMCYPVRLTPLNEWTRGLAWDCKRKKGKSIPSRPLGLLSMNQYLSYLNITWAGQRDQVEWRLWLLAATTQSNRALARKRPACTMIISDRNRNRAPERSASAESLPDRLNTRIKNKEQ